MSYQVELTDTFGGEANYSWVRRATVDVPELEGMWADMLRAAMGEVDWREIAEYLIDACEEPARASDDES